MNPDGTQAGSAHPAPEERATLFFDLDGTLIDSQVGITTCIAYALQKMEHPVPARETLLGWIGPSLRTTFAPLFIEPARVEQAVGYYRERFDAEGWREHTVYPQVEDALRTLHARGHRLAVSPPRTSRTRAGSWPICPSADCSRTSSARPWMVRAATSPSWSAKRCAGCRCRPRSAG